MFAPLGEKPLAQMRSPFQGLPDSPSGLWYLSPPLKQRAEVGIPAIRVGGYEQSHFLPSHTQRTRVSLIQMSSLAMMD